MNGRIYVTKKDAYQVEATSLLAQLRTDLGMAQLKNVILYNVYDVFHADEHDIQKRLLYWHSCVQIWGWRS